MCELGKRRRENLLLSKEKDLVAIVECCVGSSDVGRLFTGYLKVVGQGGQDHVALIACSLAQVY